MAPLTGDRCLYHSEYLYTVRVSDRLLGCHLSRLDGVYDAHPTKQHDGTQAKGEDQVDGVQHREAHCKKRETAMGVSARGVRTGSTSLS